MSSENTTTYPLPTVLASGPGGRPSKYDPAFCDRVIEYGRMGKSRTWIAAEIGVMRETLIEWEKAHPEFSDAMSRARLLSQQWWEDAGQAGVITQGFSAPVWAKNMSCRFRDEWGDKVEASGEVALRVFVNESGN
ncbi:MAG: hypothetical protein ACRC6I_18195 [Paracoccaceae bacterium]